MGMVNILSRRPFTIPEIQAVLSVADPEWQSLIKFGFYTGQRLGDLAALRWHNLDLGRSEIRLFTSKTGRRMIIPIADGLRTHIEFCLGRATRKLPFIRAQPESLKKTDSWEKRVQEELNDAQIYKALIAGLTTVNPEISQRSLGRGPSLHSLSK
jgi:integrase